MAAAESVDRTEKETEYVNKRRKELSSTADFDSMKKRLFEKLDNSPWQKQVSSDIHNAMSSSNVKSYDAVLEEVCGARISLTKTNKTATSQMPKVDLSTEVKEEIFKAWDEIIYKDS